MYLVTIKTNGVEYLINELSSRTENRIEGTIRQGINTIDSFEFTIYPNNIGYNQIIPYRTYVTVLNSKTNEYEFRGRVILQTSSLESSGLICKNFVCESELGYLCDSVQLYGEYHNVTVSAFLELLLKQHNSLVEPDKQFFLGTIEDLDKNDSLYRYLSYDTTWKNIKSDLLDKLGGELQVRHESGKMYLDYLHQIGKLSKTEITLGHNMQSLTENKEYSECYARVLPLGAKLKTVNSEGQEVETGHRMTVEEVNNGAVYVEDTELIADFGEKTCVKIWEDVTNPTNLLKKAQDFLIGQKIQISNEINAVDLSLIGLDIESFKVGNLYFVKNPLLGIECIVRIISKNFSIENPQDASITLGDFEQDLENHNLSEKKQIMQEIEKTIERQSSFEQSVDGFKLEVQKSFDEQYEYISSIEVTAEEMDIKFTEEIKGLQSEIKVTAEEISSKVGNDELQTIVTQNATSWGLSIGGKLNGTNYTFDGTNFAIGDSNSDTTAYHAPSYSKWGHTDGSYTQVDANGLKRYTSNSNRFYFYYTYTGEVIMDSWDEVTIPLPSEISGKGTDYGVMVACRSYTFGDDWANIATQQLCLYVESKTATSFTLKTFKTGLNVVDYTQKIDGTMAIQYTILA